MNDLGRHIGDSLESKSFFLPEAAPEADGGGAGGEGSGGTRAYAETLDGCYRYVCDWVDTMRPLYLMASTPPRFRYTPSDEAGVQGLSLVAGETSALSLIHI